jgi:AcrR family transcriptional regulator
MAEPSSTRGRLLAAGAQLLLEDGLRVLNRGLRTEDVADRAGLSENTFFKTFKTKENYLDELMAMLASTSVRSSQALSDKINSTLVATGGDLRRTVREVCGWDFQEVRQDHATLARVAVLVLGRQHKAAMANLRRTYAAYDRSGMTAYEAVLARWGATMRKPFSAQLVAVVLTALVEGLALRSIADPSAVPDDLFGNVVVALIGSIIDPNHNHEHIDDIVRPAADEIMLQYDAVQANQLPDHPRQAVIDAARVEFGERGYFMATLPKIAARAGVPLPVLKQLFSSKAAIVVAALHTGYAVMVQHVRDDVALQFKDSDVVTRHLTRLASFAAHNSEYVESLLMLVAHDTATTPETALLVKNELDLPGLIAPVIAAGQERGVFVSAAGAYDSAAILTNTLLLRWFTRRDEDPATTAVLVGRTLLEGLLGRPDATASP